MFIPHSVSSDYNINVFINCPFDDDYNPLFHAIIFTVHDAGFKARCSKEIADGTHDRLKNIMEIMLECKYGIHDISRTEPDPNYSLPRFNMPLELGIFLGSERFGRNPKACLIMDKEEYRYQKFISDLGSRNVFPHNNNPQKVISRVRDWLVTESKRTNIAIPGGTKIYERYCLFENQLPNMAEKMSLKVEELTFWDYVNFVVTWIKELHNSIPLPTKPITLMPLLLPKRHRRIKKKPTA